jgi:hypothetical protein
MAAIKAKVDQATGAVESFLASAPIGVKASALATGGAAQVCIAETGHIHVVTIYLLGGPTTE